MLSAAHSLSGDKDWLCKGGEETSTTGLRDHNFN